jgi:hypothetical protein
MKTCVHLSYYIGEFFLGGERFQKKIVEKIKTQILYSFNFFSFWRSCRLWYNEENMVEPDSSQIRRMRITCWITKATETLRTYKLVAFPLQQWLGKGVSMLRRSTLPVLSESPFIPNYSTYTHKQIFRNNFTVTFPQTPRGRVFLDTLLDTQSVMVH